MRKAFVVACVGLAALTACSGSEGRVTVESGGQRNAPPSSVPQGETRSTVAQAVTTTSGRPNGIAPAPTVTTRATTTTAPTAAPKPQGPKQVGTWTVADSGPLATRGEPKAVWTGKEVVVVGGLIIDQYQALSDGAAFDPATGTWRRIANRPAPGRVLFAVWTGTEVFTLGSDGIALDPISTAFAYNPVTDRWRQVPLPPSHKAPHEVFWTGQRVAGLAAGCSRPRSPL